MKYRFAAHVPGSTEVQEAVAKTVGAVIGYNFEVESMGVVSVDVSADQFWFMHGILMRLQDKGVITGFSHD